MNYGMLKYRQDHDSWRECYWQNGLNLALKNYIFKILSRRYAPVYANVNIKNNFFEQLSYIAEVHGRQSLNAGMGQIRPKNSVSHQKNSVLWAHLST